MTTGKHRGFGKAEAVLKALQLQRLYLWPRFRAEVSHALSAHHHNHVDRDHNQSQQYQHKQHEQHDDRMGGKEEKTAEGGGMKRRRKRAAAVEVEEITVSLSPSMTVIQDQVVALMEVCLVELRKSVGSGKITSLEVWSVLILKGFKNNTHTHIH